MALFTGNIVLESPPHHYRTPLLSLPKDQKAPWSSADVLESGFDPLTCVLGRPRDFRDVHVVLEVDEVRVDQRALQALVAEHVFDVQDVLGFVRLRCIC